MDLLNSLIVVILHNVYVFQTFTFYTLNIFSFYLSITFQ